MSDDRLSALRAMKLNLQLPEFQSLFGTGIHLAPAICNVPSRFIAGSKE